MGLKHTCLCKHCGKERDHEIVPVQMSNYLMYLNYTCNHCRRVRTVTMSIADWYAWLNRRKE